MEGAPETDKLVAAAIALAFVAVALLLIYVIRRARKARRREIEGAGGDDRAVRQVKPKRPALRPEDVIPEPPEEAGAPASGPARQPARSEPLPELTPPVPEVMPPVPAAVPATPPDKMDKVGVDRIEPAAPATLAPSKRTRDLSALAAGLGPTRAGWVSRLGQIFSGARAIDPVLVEEIERVLLTADIGVRTSQKLLEEIRSSLSRRALADAGAIWEHLRHRSIEVLRSGALPIDFSKAKPLVLLTIGVNGSGKTTTVGKLAAKFRAEGRSVLLVAGDTFRAAATEQLEVWGQRVSAPVVRGKEGSDPSSVIFDGIKRAAAEGVDVVIADTAGRLHTKTNLMDELQKIRRVAAKALPGAPHETWLVIDSTNGQNAIAQAQIFTRAMSVTGIVLTKLDGTAKGGVILGIADELGIPVRYIGVGERVEDLREFDAEDFVEALFERAN
ncbi:MAG: signal recognition particle-docking protein FtsY [Polyangia bacterium]